MTARLSLRNISKTYTQANEVTHALQGASLDVAAGELVAIVGPSGSGKTTLLAIAGALLAPTEGEVLIDGTAITDQDDASLARIRLKEIGFILQSSNLVPFLTARDQLEVMGYLARANRSETRKRATALMEELGIIGRAGHYPEAMSGGERQRVAIARALMNDPAVILADEPTANLDSKRGRSVVEMLLRLVREGGKAGVLVTHDERMLDLVDRTYHIADGVLTSETALAAD